MTAQVINKAWGTDSLLFDLGSVHVHHLQVAKDGYSSVHYHSLQNNRLNVIKGNLTVEIFNGNSLDYHVLWPGDYLDIAPNLVHRFITESGAEVIEHCWPWPEPDDIVRMLDGGIGELPDFAYLNFQAGHDFGFEFA